MPNLQDLQLGTLELMLALIDRIGHHDAIQRAGIDALDGVPAQHAVGDERVDARGPLLLEQLRRARDRVGRVGQVVDQDRGFARHFAHQHHGRVLSVGDLGGAAFLAGGK
jgi:hypothetical protein